MIADARLRADHLRETEGALKQLCKDTAGAASGLRRQVRRFDLPKNLWFPQHQRVQTRGHAKEMTDGLEIAQLIEMGRKLRRRDSVAGRQKGHATGHAGMTAQAIADPEWHSVP